MPTFLRHIWLRFGKSKRVLFCSHLAQILHRKNNGSALLPLVKNVREYKYDTHCPFRVRQWAEIEAEGTTPQHLLGGYKTRRRRAECDDEADSYAGAIGMAQKSLLTT